MGEYLQDGISNVKNSHAHLSLAKRRHTLRLEHCETDFRSQLAPAASPEPHFFATPEPQHMACYLYPEGPSLTARHVPEHFVDNVVYGEHPCERAKRGAQTTESGSTPGGRTQGAPLLVWNGTRQTPVTELLSAENGERALPGESRSVARSSAYRSFSARGGASAYASTPGYRKRASQSPEPFDYHNSPGRPQNNKLYSASESGQSGRVKLKHTDRWDRIAAGSQGRSVDGSDFGSVAGQRETPRRSLSMDPARSQRRSRSSDPTASRSVRQQRAASVEKMQRRRSGSSDGRRRYN